MPYMSEEHEALLKTATRTPGNENLPESLVDAYWAADRIMRRLGVRMTLETLGHLVLLTNTGPQPKAQTFLDVIETEKPALDSRVIAYFRRKWQWGFYRGVDTKVHDTPKIKVIIDDGNSEIRLIAPNKVRLPYEDELKQMGEA